MSVVYYVWPLLLVALAVYIARKGKLRALEEAQKMTPDQARQRINYQFGGSFNLQPGEALHAVYVGEEYQGERSATRQAAGAALNQLSKAAVGVSVYVPQVQVGITTIGRVLIAREYSETGSRGYFKQVVALGRGTRALDAASAHPGERIQPPMANPITRQGPPTFVQFRAPNGEHYEAWMTAGQTTGPDGFIAAFQDALRHVPGLG